MKKWRGNPISFRFPGLAFLKMGGVGARVYHPSRSVCLLSMILQSKVIGKRPKISQMGGGVAWEKRLDWKVLSALSPSVGIGEY